MKDNRISRLYRQPGGLLLLLLFTNAFSATSTLPSKTSIVNQIRRVNDYWMMANPEYGTNEWDRATYYSGLVPLYNTLRQQHYYKYAVNWATQHNWGLNGGIATRHADNHCAGQAYIMLYEIEPEQKRVSAISESMQRMVSSTTIDDWWWCDALHMAPPVMAALGKMSNADSYYTKLQSMWNDTKTRRRLWDTSDHLWFRDEDFLPPNLTPNGKHIHWSRGNGWVIAGLAKVLSILPEDAPGRSDYVTVVKQMAEALKSVQRSDGLWNSSLLDPNHFGGPEASGTCFFTFGMAWGINNGLLGKSDYLPVIAKAWNGLNSVAVHPDGMLGYCQAIGAAPAASSYNDTKDYAIGAFVLAGCELLKLAPGTFPDTVNIAPGTVSDFSSQEEGNPAAAAVDGDLLTRWSAQGYPQWIELDLGAEKALKGIDLHFLENRAYQYTLQTKLHEGDSYSTVIDSSGNRVGGKHVLQLDNISVRYVRLNVTGASGYTGDWISVSDMRVYGDDVTRVSRTPDRPASRIWTETVDGGAVVLFIPSAGTGEQLGYSLSTLDGRNIVEKTEPIGPNNRIRILSGRERGVMKSTTGLYLLQYRIISGDKTKSSGASYILLPVTSLSLRQR